MYYPSKKGILQNRVQKYNIFIVRQRKVRKFVQITPYLCTNHPVLCSYNNTRKEPSAWRDGSFLNYPMV